MRICQIPKATANAAINHSRGVLVCPAFTSSNPANVIDVIGEDQFTTTVELSKELVKGCPFSASTQSLAHRTNLTEAGTVEVWKVDGDTVSTAKGNLAVGLSMDTMS